MTEHSFGATPPVQEDTSMRKISNSEVATWLACRKKYYYEFDLSLEPNMRGTALGRGILLHDVLAVYYRQIKDGVPHMDAVVKSDEYLTGFLASPSYEMETVMEVRKLLAGYWATYCGDNEWEILEVEQTRELPMNDDFLYSLRFDLLVLERKTGKIALVDHKTCYNFWSHDEVELNAQFPKYVGSLRANGTQVDKVIINMLRTRKDAKERYKRVDAVPSRMKIANQIREQIMVSQEIVKHKELPIETRSAITPRVLNKTVCQYCDVKSLCMSELDGGDITTAIKSDYKPRTYGYNTPEEEL